MSTHGASAGAARSVAERGRRVVSASGSELERLQAQRDALTARLAKLTPHDAHLDAVAKLWRGAQVGGSGHRNAALDRRREALVEKGMANGKEIDRTLRDLERVRGQIDDLTSGRAAARQRAAAAAAERVRGAKVGDEVLDSAYGRATVVRVNQKSLTIQTPSGYREARKFSLIADVTKRSAVNTETPAPAAAPPRRKTGSTPSTPSKATRPSGGRTRSAVPWAAQQRSYRSALTAYRVASPDARRGMHSEIVTLRRSVSDQLDRHGRELESLIRQHQPGLPNQSQSAENARLGERITQMQAERRDLATLYRGISDLSNAAATGRALRDGEEGFAPTRARVRKQTA